MNKYVLGGGVAGLTYSFFDKESIVIDNNPLGQLSSPFILGPRIIEKNEKIDDFLIKHLLPKLNIDTPDVITQKIGYWDGFSISEEASEEFKKEYSIITRGKSKYESSFLSSGLNEITHYVSKNRNQGDDLYKNIFNNILDLITKEKRILNAKIENISYGYNTSKKNISIRQNDREFKICYDLIISTLNQSIFKKLIKMSYNGEYLDFLCSKKVDLSVKRKSFYICEHNEDKNNKYAYVYSIDKSYTRKTYQKDYVVYERESPLPIDVNNIDDGEYKPKIIKKVENIPIQIVNSANNLLGLNDSIIFLGRYAQWNHKIKFAEILEELIDGIGYR